LFEDKKYVLILTTHCDDAAQGVVTGVTLFPPTKQLSENISQN